MSIVLARVKENDPNDGKRSLEIHDHPKAIPILLSISITRKISEEFFFLKCHKRTHKLISVHTETFKICRVPPMSQGYKAQRDTRTHSLTTQTLHNAIGAAAASRIGVQLFR